MQIRNFRPDDWEAVRQIYQSGILTGKATFETAVPDYDSFSAKFQPEFLWVGESDGAVISWAALQPTSSRKVYEGVMEITIYVDPDFQHRGVASKLMAFIIEESEKAGIWTLYASIIQENIASIKLHESAGFRRIGYRERIAKINEEWRNTIIFERRSSKTGTS